MDQELRTTCNRDCPDSCGIIATVRDGCIIKHRGDPEHEITRGFLCYRGNHYLDRSTAKTVYFTPRGARKRGGRDSRGMTLSRSGGPEAHILS